MPRPKSELTDAFNVGIRMTPAQHLTFLRLGGRNWLRKYLDEAKDKVEKEKLKELSRK